ncbi:MAG: hypothetical protein QOK43_2913 [Acidimicrobiaceae bacterium]|nr:hypothetical protein [Acidimicrobiaceae bacterium]
MRGRDLFRRFRPLLLGLSDGLALLPPSVARLLLVLVRGVPTRFGVGIRYVIVRRLAPSCGENVAVMEDVYLHNAHLLQVGDNVSIHPTCYIDAAGGLNIGNDVSVAHGASILTMDHDHARPGTPIRDAPVLLKPVRIGNDVWIGAGARVLGGVCIADHVVVAAGAVVVDDVPTDSLVAGVPARVVRSLAATA